MRLYTLFCVRNLVFLLLEQSHPKLYKRQVPKNLEKHLALDVLHLICLLLVVVVFAFGRGLGVQTGEQFSAVACCG